MHDAVMHKIMSHMHNVKK